jgi:peptidoglycan/xylan/chitin deacetylase (PgdA/CDA1 family)
MIKITKTIRGTQEPLKVIETDAPLVAITVDDGFDKEAVKVILVVAKKKGITYTDFMKGEQRKQYPDMVQALVDSELVEFGNHTETHRDQRNAPVPKGQPNRRPTWDEFKDDLYIAKII